MTHPTAKKGSRTRLTLINRAEAARLLRKGTTPSAVTKKFDISRRLVSKIKKDCEAIIDKEDNNKLSLNKKTIRKLEYTVIDKRLIDFVIHARCFKKPIKIFVIQQKALSIRDDLLKVATDEQQ